MVNYGKHQLPDFPQELATTRQIFAFDLSLDLIEAWYLVRTDFRLIDPVKSRRLQELIMKQSAGPERVILQDYLLTVKGQNPRRPDFTLIREFLAKYPPVPDQIPVSVYRLMGGYLNYLMKEREQVQFFWKGYEEQYGYGYFNPTEQKFLPQESQVAAAPKKKNFLWIGVAVGIMMVFMPVIRGIMGGYRSTPTPRQVITPPSVELPSFEEQLKDATQDPAIAEKYQNSDEISKRFFFYFYLDQDNEGREAFITSEMAGKAQEQARALTADQVAPQVVTSQINLITLKEETDQGTLYFLRNFSMQAMLQKVPNSILLVKDGKIQEVYSTEWGTDEATFNALADQIKAANQESTDETEMPLEEQL